jgi:hypothetical protein
MRTSKTAIKMKDGYNLNLLLLIGAPPYFDFLGAATTVNLVLMVLMSRRVSDLIYRNGIAQAVMSRLNFE